MNAQKYPKVMSHSDLLDMAFIENVNKCYYKNDHTFETLTQLSGLIGPFYSHFLRSPSNNPLPRWILSICVDKSFFPLNLD